MKVSVLLPVILLVCCGVAPAQSRRSALPAGRTTAVGVVWRTSEHTDEHGGARPPWSEVRITNIFTFKTRPAVGARVTVVPLAVDIAPLELKVIGVTRRLSCDDRQPVWWEVELEPISKREFFDAGPVPNRSAEFPFDVAVVYPAAQDARQVAGQVLAKIALPDGVSRSTVKAAIDLSGDGSPDVLTVEFCCGNERAPAKDCDSTCGATYEKIRGRWKRVDSSAPC